MTCTVEQKVIGVVMTSSPGPTPSAASPTNMASVAELTASAAGAPMNAANSCSNRLTFGPVVIQSDRKVSMTSSISSSPSKGGENGRNVFRGINESLSGQFEHSGSCVRCHAEPQGLQMIKKRSNCRDQTGSLGVQQKPQCAGQT